MERRIEAQFGVTQTQYSMLYSSYSFPNMIVPICGGLILNTIGKGCGLFFFSTTITVGQLICAVGGWVNSFWLLVLGRGIHGMGSESQQMVIAVYVASWFKDQEISMAMGISQMTLLFSFVGGYSIPKIGKYYGIGNAFFAGAISCMFSFVMAMILIVLDNYSRKQDKAMKKKRR